MREPRQSGTTKATTSVLTQMALSIIAQNVLTSHHRTSYNSLSSHLFIKEWLVWVLNQPLMVCITLWDTYFPNNVPGNELRLGGILGVGASLVSQVCGSGRSEDHRFLLDARMSGRWTKPWSCSVHSLLLRPYKILYITVPYSMCCWILESDWSETVDSFSTVCFTQS